MSNLDFSTVITEASAVVGKTWPLYSFVTSNPLSGYENRPFNQAIKEASESLGSFTLPSANMFIQAWQKGDIDSKIIGKMLVEANLNKEPEFYLTQIENVKITQLKNPYHQLDTIVTKWLSVFLDEGIGEWEMPEKSKGFYGAWRKIAIYDQEIGFDSIKQIPETANFALSHILNQFSNEQISEIFRNHIAALPGYTGYIKYRMEENCVWQNKYPITLTDYLAVRLLIAKQINAPMLLKNSSLAHQNTINELKYMWLKAWEKTYQMKLVNRIGQNKSKIGKTINANELPLAQMVFCIDTRSELIRKHIEAKNNYETFGYAGFFGLATDYEDINTGLIRKSCPPIVSSAYKIVECAHGEKSKDLLKYKRQQEDNKFVDFLTKRMKNMLPSAFGFVEGAGLFYGFKLLARTIFPTFKTSKKVLANLNHEEICEPEIHPNVNGGQFDTIPLIEKVAIVNSAFNLLGWKKFAPIVVFVGHGSHSANNPFASSLDCGACAASPGRHNARMLAKMANLIEVRKTLKADFNIDIPEKTIFIGAEHDTVTDRIILFDTHIPKSHKELMDSLKIDLQEIQQTTISARVGMKAHDTKKADENANNWAETRPEWGLARNAGFIVGPRKLTKDINLDSRCFLHSYDWEFDENGSALETIMQGPMVVTQWINNHYYFSTVDNEKFGGGSKITHNVVGKYGVVQGNGGDIKLGLPLQSVNSKDQEMFHQPLRLSVVIEAPIARIEDILQRNLNLINLLQNQWIYLLAIDPTNDNQTFCYETNGKWVPIIADEIAFAKAS